MASSLSPTSNAALKDDSMWTPDRVFALYDADNSGTLDLEELNKALTATLGHPVSASEASSLMIKYDHSNTNTLPLDAFKALSSELAKTKNKRKSRMSLSNMMTSEKTKMKQKQESDYLVMQERASAMEKATVLPKSYATFPPLPSSLHPTVLHILSHLTTSLYAPNDSSVPPAPDYVTILSPPQAALDLPLIPKIVALLSTQTTYTTFTGASLPSLSTALTTFLTTHYAPLLPYPLLPLLQSSPLNESSYALALRSPLLSHAARQMFLDYLRAVRTIHEATTKEYYKSALIKFYTANNSTDKLSTVETDLSSCAGSEFSWFQALAAKYFVANPVALKDTPGMMIVATVCRVLFRVREDHAEMYLKDEDAFTMFNFLMSNGTLEYLVANSQPVADSDPMSFTAGRVFDLCEKDGSGSLGAEELEEAMTSVLGKIVTREEIDKLMVTYDADKNGSLDRAEFEKFCDDLKKRKEKQRTSLGNRLAGGFKSKEKKELERAHVKQERLKLVKRDTQRLQAIMPGAATKAGAAATSAASAPTGNNAPALDQQTVDNITTTLSYIHSHADTVVGLYRIAGTEALVKGLVEKITKTGGVSMVTLPVLTEDDVHVACSAVKRILMRHAPLIPYGMFGQLMKCKEVDQIRNFFERVGTEGTVKWRPMEVKLLKGLLSHLGRIAGLEDKNKMGVKQLATTIGQTILRESEDPPTDLSKAGAEAKDKVRIVILIVENRVELFGEEGEIDGVIFKEEDKAMASSDKATKQPEPEATLKQPEPAEDDEKKPSANPATPPSDAIVELRGKLDAAAASPPPAAPLAGSDMTIADVTLDVTNAAIETTLPTPATPPPAAASPPLDQCSLKVYWKKGSSDEPLNEEEVADAFGAFGKVVKIGLKAKVGAVQFETVEGCQKALKSYNGPWKIKPFKAVTMDASSTDAMEDAPVAAAPAPAVPAAVEAAPSLTVVTAAAELEPVAKPSSTTSASTPMSTKSLLLIHQMEERSIKISWKSSSAFANSPPTQAQLAATFAAFGKIDKVIIQDAKKNAVMIFTDAAEAEAAERDYEGSLKVRVVANASSKATKVKTTFVASAAAQQPLSPAAGAAADSSVWVDAPGSSLYALNPLKTPPHKSSPLPSALGSADAFSAAFSAAQQQLSREHPSPQIAEYNRLETNAKREKTTETIARLVERLTQAEAALERATEMIQEMRAKKLAEELRAMVTTEQKAEFDRGWASEAMVLQLQLKEAETSDAQARKLLLEKERENQIIGAELHSLERTAKTINLVQEKAYESARRDVGAELAMQENRLEGQGTEIGTLSQANADLAEEVDRSAQQHRQACTEVVAWRARAEAAELELKSLGRYASTKEEKRSLEIARLLNSKVVGVGLGVEDLPVHVTSPKRNGGNADTSSSSWGVVDTGSSSEFKEAAFPSPTRSAIVDARVLTSKDVLKEAWSAQKALAERLDREIYLAGFKLEQSLAKSDVGMGGYELPRAWR